jgi:protein translocase SecG subunit
MSHTTKILELIQLGLGVVLIAAILGQNRGAGVSGVFGGSGAIHRTKRGFEKWLYYVTIVLAIIFIGISIAAVLSSKA